jgi:hypothetical protein
MLSETLERERMKYEYLQWKGLTIWGLPSLRSQMTGERHYQQFEIYSLRDGSTYKLIVTNPWQNPHISGWELWRVRFGDTKPYIKLSEHPMLRESNFEELFSAMCVLVDEEVNTALNPNITNSEIKRMKKKWLKWMRELPDWVRETVQITDIWVEDHKKEILETENKKE